MRIQNQKTVRAVKIICSALSFALTLAWLGFIFSNSLKSGIESGEQSSKVHEVVNQVAGSLGVKEEISESAVRSGAHFTEFAILGLLVCLCMASLWRLRGKRLTGLMLFACLSVPVCAIMAAIDEWLQTFSEGRAAQWTDGLLDTAGAAVGTALFLITLGIVLIVKNKKQKGNDHESQ